MTLPKIIITMEIINKSHDKISSNKRIDLASYVRFDEKIVYFSAGAVDELGLVPDISINFVNDDEDWLFYCDTNKDGFKLVAIRNKKSIIICDASLTHLFSKRTRISLPCKFPLIELKSSINGNHLVKIDLSKPF